MQAMYPRKEIRQPPQVLKEVLRENTKVRVVERRNRLGLPSYSLLLEQHFTGDRSNETVGLLHVTPQLLQQLEVVREAAEWCSRRLARN